MKNIFTKETTKELLKFAFFLLINVVVSLVVTHIYFVKFLMKKIDEIFTKNFGSNNFEKMMNLEKDKNFKNLLKSLNFKG